MKRMIAWMLICAAAVFLSGCGKSDTDGKIRIGISLPSADHGWTGGVVWWAQQAKKKFEAENPDVEILLSTAKDAGEQVDKVENLLIRGIQALVILPHEPGPLTGICERAAKKGVFLVAVDRGLSRPVYDVMVAGDNRGFGAVCGRKMAEYLGGKGRLVIMEGIPCQVNTDRVQAFREEMAKYPGISILDSQPAFWNVEKGLALMENYLQKHDRIDAVWTGDDDVLLGALKAYEESGRKDIRMFVGGAGSKTVIRKVLNRDPLVPFDVTYPPGMILNGVEQAMRGLKNRQQEKKGRVVTVPAEVITPENAASFYFEDSMY